VRSAKSRQELAFEAYLAMGPDRSLAKLAQLIAANPAKYGFTMPPSRRTLEGWSSDYGWQRELYDVAGRARDEAKEQYLKLLNAHRTRLRNQGRLLQDLGADWLQRKQPEDVKVGEAIAAIETGVSFEASALTDNSRSIALTDEQKARLSDSQLQALTELLQTAIGEQPVPKSAKSRRRTHFDWEVLR
jgi:hypothetical protein